MSKLQDKGKDVPALHTAPNHEGVWDSGGTIQIMLSCDNKGKGVIHHGHLLPAKEAVVSLDMGISRTQSGYGSFGKDKILRWNPQWVWTF